MIIYLTKETFERYKLKMPEEFTNTLAGSVVDIVLQKETGDRLMEWGGKLFYFDRRKCLQLVNFASKLTFVLVDVKMKDVENIGDMLANYMFKLYEGNQTMMKLLKRLFADNPVVAFSRLKDRSIIATLNHTQSSYLYDGYLLGDYIRDGILHTLELNHDINREYLFSQKIDGKTEYFYAAERFEKLLRERYARK